MNKIQYVYDASGHKKVLSFQ